MFRRIEVEDVAEGNHGELDGHNDGKARDIFEESYTAVMEWDVSILTEDYDFDVTCDGGTKTRKHGFGILEGAGVCADGLSGVYLSLGD